MTLLRLINPCGSRVFYILNSIQKVILNSVRKGIKQLKMMVGVNDAYTAKKCYSEGERGKEGAFLIACFLSRVRVHSNSSDM